MGKRIINTAIVVLLIIVALIWYVSFQSIDLYKENISLAENQKGNSRLEEAKSQLYALNVVSKGNVLFIADLVKRDRQYAVDPEVTSKMLVDFLRTHKDYFQARFIDTLGMEQIRAESSQNKIFATKRENLSNKQERYYFQESINLTKGEIFISYLDLNIENGQIEVPYRPTIRFFTPIYIKDQLQGVVGLNLDANQWLKSFREKGIYLLNSKNQLFDGNNENETYMVSDIDLGKKDSSGNDYFLSKKIALEGGNQWTIYTLQDINTVQYKITSYRNKIYRSSFFLTLGSLIIFVLTYIFYKKNRAISNLNVALNNSLNERNTLLKEIHHRVKNNLQVITSLLSLQSSFIGDEETKGMLRYSQYRINSMAMVHEMLYSGENLRLINFRDYLQTLVSTLIDSMKGSNSGIVLNIDAKEIFLNVDTSIPLGLMINEIVTNSLKYGFKGKDSGTISIVGHKLEYPNFCILIGDNGIGFPNAVNFRNTKSLGLKLIHRLALQLKGNIEKDNSEAGTHYIITFQEIEQTS